jgi:hypothetical protein
MMRKIISALAFTALFFALFIIWTPSMAQGDLGDILTKFHPTITMEEEYNNNINLTAKNKIDDFITTISPGLNFSTSDGDYQIDLDYVLGLVFYGKEEDNNYVSHLGKLNAWYTLDHRWNFRAREYFIQSDEVREQDFSATALEDQYLLSTERQRAIFFRNVFEPSLEYQFGKEDRLGLNYRSNIYEIQSRLYPDSREDFVNPNLSYWFNTWNGISLEYGLTLGHFEQSPDLLGHMAVGHYIHRFSPRTSIFGEYTFLRRDFESPSIDYDVHRPSLGIEHAFNPTLSSKAQMGYFWQNPEQGSTKKGFFYDMSLIQRAQKTVLTLTFQGGYVEDYFTAENLGFTKYYRAIGAITHRLRERITVGLSTTGERAEYGGGRIDRIWGMRGNASYQVLKWLTASLEGSHRENHSNVDNFNYSEYRGIFRMTASFY